MPSCQATGMSIILDLFLLSYPIIDFTSYYYLRSVALSHSLLLSVAVPPTSLTWVTKFPPGLAPFFIRLIFSALAALKLGSSI